MPASQVEELEPDQAWDLGTVSLWMQDVEAEVVLSELAAQVGVSVVVPSAQLGRVSVAFDEVPAEQAIRGVCDQVGRVPVLEYGVIRLVDRASYEAEEVALVLPGYEDVTAASDAIRDALGDGARVRPVGSRVLVVGPRGVVERAAEIGRRLRAGPDAWAITVKLVQVQESWLERQGIGLTSSGGVDLNILAGTGNVQGLAPIAGARVSAVLSALAEAVAGGSEARMLTTATVYLLEGESGTVRNGEVVPIPRKVVSDQGTVTTAGFEFLPVGFEVVVGGRRVPDGLRLDVSVDLSVISGFVEGAPIQAERFVQGSAVVDSGDSIMLFGLDAISDRTASDGALFGFGADEWSSDRTRLLLVLDAVRVYASGAKDARDSVLESSPPGQAERSGDPGRGGR